MDTRINVIAFLAFLAVLTPPSVFAAKDAHHPRTNKTASRVATRVVEPPTIILNPDREILIRLEKGQKALEMHTTDLAAALGKQGEQLSRGIDDARKETQQMFETTDKRIKLLSNY